VSNLTFEEIQSAHDAHAWQPFTQMKLEGRPVVIERAEGLYLIASDGRRIMDGVGSWWVSVHGHNHPHIIQAVQSQLQQLDQVMYAGFTHAQAALLSKRLAMTTENQLPRVFFSDNGACAVEIALKICFQSFFNRGEKQRRRFVTLERGYHGDTIGTMAAGARSIFHEPYTPLLFDVLKAEAPFVPFALQKDAAAVESHLQKAVQSLETIFAAHGHEICALILEPLIQGAGGMNIYPPAYLKEARRITRAHNALLIADEVFTGFGRTGTFYACEQAGIWPDVMALSKGLTAGVIPLGATLASEELYQSFYSDDRMMTFFHGHSMTANPAGCAAANASLDLLDDSVLQRVREMEQWHNEELNAFKSQAGGKAAEVRALGSVAAMELSLSSGITGDFSPRFRKDCIDQGLLVRPLGNVVYLCPPYSVTRDQLHTMYEIITNAVQRLA
jgi:adenosylmethionine-8-amino-7-oxononanoate aminotransferase